MPKPGHPGRLQASLWVLSVLAGLLLLGLLGWALWRIPQELYAYVPEGKDRAAAEASTRTGMIAGLAGLAALGGLAITVRTYRLTVQGQLTDRYTKAIAQLGDAKLDIRLGGIYALERLAVDSARDQPTIVEVISAFIREHAKGGLRRPDVDIQAALTVLGRLPARRTISRGSLNRAPLRGAQLDKCNLTGADLSWANLQEAELRGAHLAKADCTRTDLTGAKLNGANLIGATFIETDLSGANLNAAKVSVEDLRAALWNTATVWPPELQDAIRDQSIDIRARPDRSQSQAEFSVKMS